MEIKYQHFRINKDTGRLEPWFKPRKSPDGEMVRPGYEPDPRGGMTICFLFDEDFPTAYGIAECSLKDQFQYKVGRKIALDRAIATFNGKKIPYKMSRKSPCRRFFETGITTYQAIFEPNKGVFAWW